MSTVNNGSRSFRRRSIISSESSKSNTPVHSPRLPRVITTRPSEPASPVHNEDLALPETEITQRRGWDELQFFWHEFVARVRSPGFAAQIRNRLLLLGLFSILFALIPWKEIQRTRSAIDIRDIPPRMYGRLFLPDYEHRRNIYRDEDPKTLQVYELVGPIARHTDFDILYVLDSLQAAYSDFRYSINKLKDNLPVMSADSPGLSKKFRDFRDEAWKLSEAIGKYRKSFDPVIRKLRDECNNLKLALSKVKPENRWEEDYDPDSEEGRKIEEIWLSHYERLKEEIKHIPGTTTNFRKDITKAIDGRKGLAKALNEAQPRMIREAKKRQWNNFHFGKANELLERLAGPADRTKIGTEYERLLQIIANSIESSLFISSEKIKLVTEKLQKSRFQKSAKDGVNETGGDGTGTKSVPELIKVPPLSEQIKGVEMVIEEFDGLIRLLDEKRVDLEKGLRGKVHGSTQKRLVYDYAIDGREQHDIWRKGGEQKMRDKRQQQEREKKIEHGNTNKEDLGEEWNKKQKPEHW